MIVEMSSGPNKTLWTARTLKQRVGNDIFIVACIP